MRVNYNISELFKTAFGIKQPIYYLPEDNNKKPSINYQGLEMLPDYYESDSQSWMGTPILFSATFKGDSYKKFAPSGEIVRTSLEDFTLPAATLFSFRRAKNITRTNVNGDDGSVKEIFGFDDWIIDVRGLALDEPTISAHEQITQLLLWEELADAIKVTGKLFNQRRIDRVVMSDWSDNVTQGKSGVISFQFQLMGDKAIELII